jgi:ubiquinone/menaquinone biosynthesis C-methylase UbiE
MTERVNYEMLRKARERNLSGGLVRATANVLPFRSGSFELIFCVSAHHHFGRFEDFIAEARGVLGPDGALAIFGMDPHHGHDSWCVYDYFPETRAIDLARYPSSGAVTECDVSCRL